MKTLDERNKLITDHLYLVGVAVSKIGALYHYNDIDELLAAGNIGLIQAADKFDPSKGFKFSTYAMIRIKGAIIDNLRVMDWLPRSLRSKQSKARYLMEVRDQFFPNQVSDDDVYRECEIRGRDRIAIEPGFLVSLDTTQVDDGEGVISSLKETIPSHYTIDTFLEKECA